MAGIISFKGEPYDLDMLYLATNSDYENFVNIDRDISDQMFETLDETLSEIERVFGVNPLDCSNGATVGTGEWVKRKPFFTYDPDGDSIAYLYNLYKDSISIGDYIMHRMTTADLSRLNADRNSKGLPTISENRAHIGSLATFNKNNIALVYDGEVAVDNTTAGVNLFRFCHSSSTFNIPVFTNIIREDVFPIPFDTAVASTGVISINYGTILGVGTGYYITTTFYNGSVYPPYATYLLYMNADYDVEDNSDPYIDNDAASSSEQGTPTKNNTSDNEDFTSLPSKTGLDTGFITSYNISSSALKSLASKLWSDDAISNIRDKLFSNPIDAIIDLHITPIDIGAGASSPIKLGTYDTGVSADLLTNRYVELDCGSVKVAEYFGGFMDYSPYTKISIFLPYIGVQDLNVDDVMNTNVHIKYFCDILSGSVVAQIKCSGGRNNRADVLYHFSGDMNTMLPVTQADYTSKYQALLGAVTTAGVGLATGGVGAVAGAVGSVGNIMGAKVNVSRSGNVSGTTGYLDSNKPYLIIQRPRQCVPSNQKKLVGYPSLIGRKLNQFSGYTICKEARVTSKIATKEELELMHDVLTEGVII